MARAFWKGSISFGLVEIPVSLRPAIRTHDLDFTLLDRKDFSPVGYRRYNKNTGREVPWERVIRGYEYEKGDYVALSDEELKRANIKATQTVEIVEFVELEAIDPVFFDTPYYVEPLKRASKAYTLLRTALEKTGRAGIAKVVLRTRQHLAALVVRGGALVLELLHYASEVVPADDLEVPAAGAARSGVRDPELAMAVKLVEGMSSEWNPERFEDEYRKDVLDLVQRKVKSGETHAIVEPAPGRAAPAKSEVMDLMPLLKQSLESSTSRSRATARRPAARARNERRPAAAAARARRRGPERRRSA